MLIHKKTKPETKKSYYIIICALKSKPSTEYFYYNRRQLHKASDIYS